MKKFFKAFSLVLFFISVSFFGECIYLSKDTPDIYHITDESEITLSSIFPISIKSKPKSHHSFTNISSNISFIKNGKLTLLNVFPIKSVQLQMVEDNIVTLCGIPFGIKLFTNGPMVINISNVNTEYGIKSPAQESGIQLGDTILKINGSEIKSNEDLAKFVELSNGESINLSILRENRDINISVTPLKSVDDKKYKVGMWVRDSSGGIGTITFYIPSSKIFCGLGHGICDVDTGKIMPLSHGDIMESTIKGINKGARGSPGELKGSFKNCEPMGELFANTETGIYGILKSTPFKQQKVKIAMKHQVKTGAAKILTTIYGEEPQYFDINIESINYNENNPTKNILISVTDPNLIEKSGGIVQGMSGSPIIQNGLLIGAVTHVFIKQPNRGCAIFAETMLTNSNNILGLTYKNAS